MKEPKAINKTKDKNRIDEGLIMSNLVNWRIVLFGKIMKETKPCDICQHNAFWGKRCCWECPKLDDCILLWKEDYKISSVTSKRHCPYAKEHLKWCNRVYEKYLETVKNVEKY